MTQLPNVFKTPAPDVPLLFETLRKDPKVMGIFLDEVAKADMLAPRHERFLNSGKPFPLQAKLYEKLPDYEAVKQQIFGR